MTKERNKESGETFVYSECPGQRAEHHPRSHHSRVCAISSRDASGFWTYYQHHLIATLDGEGNGERLVAEQNGSIVGSVMLFPPATNPYANALISTSYPEVRFLAVLPQTRGQGIGTALMKECERRAREAGAQAIGLHTAEVMRTAIRMYERLGYVRTPETDFRPSEGVVVLGYRHTW